MDGRAFGSPVAAVNATTCAPRSVGDRIIRATRIRLFQEPCPSTQQGTEVRERGIVELLNANNIVVGTGMIDNSLKCGMELNAVKLCPFEVAIRVVHVYDGSVWTGELVGERLSQCVGLTIRWEKARVRTLEGTSTSIGQSSEGQNFSFPAVVASQFEFEDEVMPSNHSNSVPNTLEDSGTIGNMSPLTEGSRCSTGEIPRVDGLPMETQTRRYHMQNRRRRAQTPRERGEPLGQKVTLDSVLAAKRQGGCKQNCLRDVDEKYILDQRYMAWGQKYEQRATWMLQMLNAFYSRTEGIRRDKFKTKLDGLDVCNACYAKALGYSQRRFKQLKVSHQVYGRVAAVHGNTCKLREGAKMSAARECFGEFVREAGCTQPHRQIRRKLDNTIVPLILLPMNTTKVDVFHYVNEEVKKLVDGEPLSITSFHRLWRTEFPHVQIPPFSRFSKCYHCWEYKCGMEATTNAAARVEIKKLYIVHINHQMEERRDYWLFKRSAMITPDFYMCLIVDGMDQNTTMVPKMRQTVKNIESRFVKTHLCGVLVHGIGLYADVWIDAHHKHDSNQVITTVMHVIADVKKRKGKLAPTLRIQADNTTRENKNIYMFAMCASLVGLGFFKEVQLCFLVVGHTHEDIDQRFSIISNTLKRTNIDSLKQLLQLVEKGSSYTEAFVSARHLENVRDWKSFITPHLLTGGDALTGITFPHHMRFYMENGVPRVQHKHFSKDAWEPTEGHLCLRSVPSVSEKPDLAKVFGADERELKALDEFIGYKERCVERLQNVERNLEAIEEVKWLASYLKEFPNMNRDDERAKPFWVDEPGRDSNGVTEPDGMVEGDDDTNAMNTEVGLIMATMPNPEARRYFGPRRGRPSAVAVTTVPRRRVVVAMDGATTTTSTVGAEDPFPPFNPESDIRVGHFVALTVEPVEVRAGVPFYVGKVLEFGQGKWAAKMKVVWYWPMRGRGMQDERESSRARYTNCMEAFWEPSGEGHGWVVKDAAIFSWENAPIRTRSGLVHENNVPVHGELTEAKIKIPTEAKPHLVEYIALQLEEMDNERLQNDLDAY